MTSIRLSRGSSAVATSPSPTAVGSPCTPVPLGKPPLAVVVVGHVDAGKSTLMGHFLHAVGVVDVKTIRKFERESRAIGKASFSFAWVLDQNEDEVRSHVAGLLCAEVSMSVAVRTLVDLCGAACSRCDDGCWCQSLRDRDTHGDAAGCSRPPRLHSSDDHWCHGGMCLALRAWVFCAAVVADV
jgi:hypothetical protein